MVVLHPNYHLVLHGQPCRLPDGGEDGIPHRLGRRLGKADKNRVRSSEGWSYYDLLQGETRQSLSTTQAKVQPLGPAEREQSQTASQASTAAPCKQVVPVPRPCQGFGPCQFSLPGLTSRLISPLPIASGSYNYKRILILQLQKLYPVLAQTP